MANPSKRSQEDELARIASSLSSLSKSVEQLVKRPKQHHDDFGIIDLTSIDDAEIVDLTTDDDMPAVKTKPPNETGRAAIVPEPMPTGISCGLAVACVTDVSTAKPDDRSLLRPYNQANNLLSTLPLPLSPSLPRNRSIAPEVCIIKDVETEWQLVEATTPGARARHDAAQAQLDHDIANGLFSQMGCYLPNHGCSGAEPNKTPFRRHEDLDKCGNCLEAQIDCFGNKDNNGVFVCTHCNENGLVCLTKVTYERVSMASEHDCWLMRTTGYWKVFAAFLTPANDYKLNWLYHLAIDYINERTKIHDRSWPFSTTPCKDRNLKDRKPYYPSRCLSLFCDHVLRHTKSFTPNLLRVMFIVDAIKRGDQAALAAAINSNKEVGHLHPQIGNNYCWEWSHTVMQTAFDTCVRQNLHFTGKVLCECAVPCFNNGKGGRFVRNPAPFTNGYGFWMPAPGIELRAYATAE